MYLYKYAVCKLKALWKTITRKLMFCHAECDLKTTHLHKDLLNVLKDGTALQISF